MQYVSKTEILVNEIGILSSTFALTDPASAPMMGSSLPVSNVAHLQGDVGQGTHSEEDGFSCSLM